jgi:uncharacterized protein (DUF849 family)
MHSLRPPALDPLIITSNDPMVPPGTPDELERNLEEAVLAAEAGATIVHHHAIARPRAEGARLELDVDRSVELFQRIRESTDAITQLGITLATNETRMAVAAEAHPEMLSITLSDNDHYGRDCIHRDRDDMIELAQFCLDHGIAPEWEIFNAGAVWNLLYLIKNGLARPPYFINLTLYPEGSGWSPRLTSEIDHRVSLLPEQSVWHLVAFARAEAEPVVEPITPDEHTRLLCHAILRNGGIRTGKEDRPLLAEGVPAKTNAELIRPIAELSEALGRPVATPGQGRELLGIRAPQTAAT